MRSHLAEITRSNNRTNETHTQSHIHMRKMHRGDYTYSFVIVNTDVSRRN